MSNTNALPTEISESFSNASRNVEKSVDDSSDFQRRMEVLDYFKNHKNEPSLDDGMFISSLIAGEIFYDQEMVNAADDAMTEEMAERYTNLALSIDLNSPRDLILSIMEDEGLLSKNYVRPDYTDLPRLKIPG